MLGDKMLGIEIRCGETTCAFEPGVFCRYTGLLRFGTKPICMLFPSESDKGMAFTELVDKGGWLQRCDACIAAGNKI